MSEKTGVGGGGTPDPADHRYIDVFTNFRGPFLGLLGFPSFWFEVSVRCRVWRNHVTALGMGEVIPLLPPQSDLPEAVMALRTERERVFVWSYMFNGANGADAARKAGYSDVKEGAKVRAHGLLQRGDIQDALRQLSTKYLFSLAPKALSKLNVLLDSEDEKVLLKAVDMTLSRTGHSERTALDVNVNGEVRHVNATKSAVDDLRRLKGLGVPRDELERVFGFSGLSRYEKLLAADEAKLIEARPVDG